MQDRESDVLVQKVLSAVHDRNLVMFQGAEHLLDSDKTRADYLHHLLVSLAETFPDAKQYLVDRERIIREDIDCLVDMLAQIR
jgi:hypothetical protein